MSFSGVDSLLKFKRISKTTLTVVADAAGLSHSMESFGECLRDARWHLC
jgi:hypothetical protein